MSVAAVLLPGFEGAELPAWLRTRLADGLAGVCLFGANVVSRPQLRELTDAIRAANPRAVIAIDEEGGDVTRLFHAEGSPYPGNAVLGRIDDLALTSAVGESVGRQLLAAGVTLGLAPDADINSNDDNPVIGPRSFGTDPALVARHTAAWIAGLQSSGVAACAKHFPGHGGTAVDSHLGLPVVDLPLETLRERELVPFRAAVEAGSRAIMTSHILLPQLDADQVATFSSRILRGLLRDELGFGGAIVSDALDMRGASGGIGVPEAAVRALNAGADLLCLGAANTDAQLREIEAALAAVDPARVAEAAERVTALAASPGAAEAEPEFGLEPTIGAFDVTRGVVSADHRIAQLETGANIAVGSVPWGPAAAGASVVIVREGEPVPTGGAQTIVVGRDNHRRAWTRTAIDAARRADPTTLVVDMGWPSADRTYADVATFGASRHVGQAVLRWIQEAQR